jgi:DNA adenine methylase
MRFLSPLRYPGGKRKLSNFMKLVFCLNGLLDGTYAEPYAGGASVALALLYDEYVREVHINDLDYAIYAFWYSVLNMTESLCRLIRDTPVTIDQWHLQKATQYNPASSILDLGFSTFFLNRTNRSGIINGGVIGGKQQTGKWKLDARYNKKNLIDRIEKVARYRSRIHLHNMDASDFIGSIVPTLPMRSLVYLDPPYYVKGRQKLYADFYEPDDHQIVALLVRDIERQWIVSYDDLPQTRALYEGFKYLAYGLHYSAQDHYRGSEVMFVSDGLKVPSVVNPTTNKQTLHQIWSKS